MSEIRAVRLIAANAHGDQEYEGHFSGVPYVEHLDHVAWVLRLFGFRDFDMQAAAYLHDVVEDTDMTLDEVRALAGDAVARIVEAVTDADGATRAERKAATYPKIRALPNAVAVKLADRIANVACASFGSRWGRLYADEHAAFKAALYVPGEFDAMWANLDALIAQHTPEQQ